MMTVTMNSCPACFEAELKDGKCPVCGYSAQEEVQSGIALQHFTMLNKAYLTGKVLGVGGFGITYTAQNIDNGQLCCIKEYVPSTIVNSRINGNDLEVRAAAVLEYGEGKEHFIEEARILKQLRSNITVVNIRDFFEQNNTAYLVMELLQGCNLRAYQQQHIDRKGELLKLALEMVMSIGSALMEVHRFGVLHGDISPENIFITKDGDIKLIDFGSAKACANGPTVQKGRIFLKPNYAPPEQYNATGHLGPWSDIYSLAATYYAVVTGVKVPDARERAKGKAYMPLCDYELGFSREYSQVIDKALALDYHERYQDVGSFLDDLGKQLSIRPEQEPPLAQTQDTQSVPIQKEQADPPPAPARPSAPQAPPTPIGGYAAAQQEALQSQEKQGKWPFKEKQHYSAPRLHYLEMYMPNQRVKRWVIPEDQDIVIGRLPSCQVVTPPVLGISREHCVIRYDSQRHCYLITDRSTGGTFLQSGFRLIRNTQEVLPASCQFYLTVPQYCIRLVEGP